MLYVKNGEIITANIKNLISCISITVTIALSCSINGYAFFGNDIKFENISLGEEFLNQKVISIIQDQKGFLWGATKDAIFRYDGYNIIPLYFDKNKVGENYRIEGLEIDNQNFLWSIFTDGSIAKHMIDENETEYYNLDKDIKDIFSMEMVGDKLCISSNKGLIFFDTKKEIKAQNMPIENSEIFSDAEIIGITSDDKNNLFALSKEGIYRINLTDLKVEHLRDSSEENLSLSKGISYSSDEHLMIPTDMGFYDYDIVNNKMTEYYKKNGSQNTLSSDKTTFIDQLKAGVYAIGTEGGGLNLFDSENVKFENYQVDSNNIYSIGQNNIYSLMKDNYENIWIGTKGEISKVSYLDIMFNHIVVKNNSSNSIISNDVNATFIDSRGSLWIGSNKGLNLIDSKTGEISYFKHNENDNSSISNNYITSITEDKEGNVWIGTKIGLNVYEPSKNAFISFNYNSEDKTSISSDLINYVYSDSKGNVWVGTNFGLNIFEPTQKNFIRYANRGEEPKGLTSFIVRTIFEDSLNNIWVGTDNGLNRIDILTKEITHFKSDDGTTKKFVSSSFINSIHEDEEGFLWIGTLNGIDKFDLKNNTIENNLHKEILKGKNNQTQILGVVSIKDWLWVSTTRGITRINKSNGKSYDYNSKNGLPRNEFKEGGIYLSTNNTLFFVGDNGVIFLDPLEEIKAQISNIHFTEIKIGGIPVSVKDNVNIPYKESVINFEFAIMDFSEPKHNIFEYMLEGFDKTWVASGNRNFVSYTNLSGGNYVLKIRGKNSNIDTPKSETSISIFMETSPWKTKTAYTIYVLFILSTILGVIKLRAMAQEKKINAQKIIIENLHKIDKMKDDFLANTSHELRTPLNGIIGISESMIDGATGNLKPQTISNLGIIVSSSRKLLKLVNEIVDFSKANKSELSVDKKPFKAYSKVEEIINILKHTPECENIEIINSLKREEVILFSDEEKFEQILYNIIGNAVKFTNEGYVKISGKICDDMMEFSIEDSGIGIAEDSISEIFKEFVQADGSISRKYGGTGLGLSISQKLIELLDGDINVKSILGKGSTFSFTLPIFTGNIEEYENANEIKEKSIFKEVNLENQIAISNEIELQDETLEKKDFVIFEKKDDNVLFNILVADDEPANIQIFKNYFSIYNNINLICAKDGFEALEYIEKNSSIDILLLDVMMPNMSGFELTKKIRKEKLMFEMPIILLTAKDQPKDIVDGFLAGANDYLVKPFEKSELFSRMKNLIMLKKAVNSAILNAKSLELEKKRRVLSELLGDITKKMSALLEENQILNYLKDVIKANLDFEKGFIMMDSQNYVLNLMEEDDGPDQLLLDSYNDIYKIVKNSIDKKNKYQPLENYVNVLFEKEKINEGVESIYTSWHEIPIVFREEILGIICIKKEDANSYYSNDEGILKAISSQTGIAIINARLYSEVEQAANTDYLTKLLNRRSFLKKAEQIYRNSIKKNQNFAVLLMDIDHFKKINDTYGHLTGDNVLKSLAQYLNKFNSNQKIAGRFGGEEFIVVLPDLKNSENIKELVDRIRADISKLTIKGEDGQDIRITISIGVTVYKNDLDLELSLTEIISISDKALYKAKEAGRNQVVFLEMNKTL